MLESVFTDIGRTDTRFVFYAPGESDIPSWFTTQNVAVTHHPLTASTPEPFLSIESGGDVVGTLTLAQLDDLLTPPIIGPGNDEFVSDGYKILFEVLDEAVFTALNRDQLLTVSREIEDRAYRVGHGTLRVCFQTFSTFKSQLPVYRHLAEATDLDIHIYAIADWEPPGIDGVTYHEVGETDLDLYWLLAFDAGDDSGEACGLFAREDDESYTGYWTDDRAIIERVNTELQTTIGDSPSSAD